jgi:hypothetical protein
MEMDGTGDVGKRGASGLKLRIIMSVGSREVATCVFKEWKGLVVVVVRRRRGGGGR